MTAQKVSKMNDAELRVTIAERMGWKYLGYKPCQPCWESPDGRRIQNLEAPDYPNDLNAMQEVEKSLTKSQLIEQLQMLEVIVVREKMKQAWEWGFATARQRAEAYVIITEKA